MQAPGRAAASEAVPLLGHNHLTTTRIRVSNLCCEMEVGLARSLLEPLDGVRDVRVRTWAGRHPQEGREFR
jgi:hypothetical protein